MKINELKVGDRVKFNAYLNGSSSFPYILEGEILNVIGDKFLIKDIKTYTIYSVSSELIISKLEEVKTYKEVLIEKPFSLKTEASLTAYGQNSDKTITCYGNLANGGSFRFEGLPVNFNDLSLHKHYIIEIKEKE